MLALAGLVLLVAVLASAGKGEPRGEIAEPPREDELPAPPGGWWVEDASGAKVEVDAATVEQALELVDAAAERCPAAAARAELRAAVELFVSQVDKDPEGALRTLERSVQRACP